VFEFESEGLGAQSGVGGGGRYDGLIEQLGGPATPANGWALGVERVALALGEGAEAAGPLVFIVAEGEQRERALVIATELRRAGLAAELDLGGRAIKGQMRQADRSGARHALILEGASAPVLRDMRSGEQREIDPGRLAEELEMQGRSAGEAEERPV
jgi:histidyl-tRNA synthetase